MTRVNLYRFLLAAALSVAATGWAAIAVWQPALASAQAPAAVATTPFADFTTAWRDDAIWHDGKAECARYEGTRSIYGQLRRFEARLYTNKELADPHTKTKSATDQGRETFKHHLVEVIPTDNYAYKFSTMCYVGTSDLKSLKLDMGSQEDCGATFKQYVNHAGTLEWRQFSYFPGEGQDSGSYAPPANFAFQDALSLVLRGYPFNQPQDIELQLLPDQTTNKWTPSRPAVARVRYVGREKLDLPAGVIEAHHLRVTEAGVDRRHDYWFAVEDGHKADGPGLHVMVQYEGPQGRSYRLKQLERRAYWERSAKSGS